MVVVQIIVSFVAVVTFSITLGVPKKFLPIAGGIGAIGWIVYLLSIKLGLSTVISSLISAFIIAILSAILAKLCKTLISTFYVPGILPIVPGVRIIQNGILYVFKK